MISVNVFELKLNNLLHVVSALEKLLHISQILDDYTVKKLSGNLNVLNVVTSSLNEKKKKKSQIFKIEHLNVNNARLL